jgi:hypothetical protein
MATKKLSGTELQEMLESMAVDILDEQVPEWLRKTLKSPEHAQALNAALTKQQARRKNMTPEELQQDKLEREVMNLVAASHPTPEERSRMQDIFLEEISYSRSIASDTMQGLERRLKPFVEYGESRFFNDIETEGSNKLLLHMTAPDLGYVTIAPSPTKIDFIILKAYDLDNESLGKPVEISAKNVEKIIATAEHMLESGL